MELSPDRWQLENADSLLLMGVVGSTAYGMDNAGSDIDELGVFAAPTAAFHGLRRIKESRVTTKPDRTLHEAGKWCRLALQSNPTAMELVWLSEYVAKHPLGEELIGLRRCFLSEVGVREAYLGYARDQFERLQRRTTPSTRGVKHARHLLRLLEQGTALHRTGELPIRVEDPEKLIMVAELIAKHPLRAEASLKRAAEIFDGPGVLPQMPREAPVEAWLQQVRKEFF